jgi:hypothetical protein
MIDLGKTRRDAVVGTLLSYLAAFSISRFSRAFFGDLAELDSIALVGRERDGALQSKLDSTSHVIPASAAN